MTPRTFSLAPVLRIPRRPQQKQQNNNAQPPSAARKARQPYTFSPQHLTDVNSSDRDGGDEQDDEKGGDHRDEYRWADGERGFFQVSTGAVVCFRSCFVEEESR